MGIELARSAFERGGSVELWLGRHEVAPPPWIPVRPFESTADLLRRVKGLTCDYCLVPAAISDFAPRRREGKVPTAKGRLTLELDPTPKVIDAIRKESPGTLVAFKAESGVTKKELIARAKERLRKSKADFIVANDLRKVTKARTSLTVLSAGGKSRDFEGLKAAAADFIWEVVAHPRRG